MPRAAIFDVAGGLIDSVDLRARAWQGALGDYGHGIAFDVVRSQIDTGSDQLMPGILSEDNRPTWHSR